MMYKYEFKKKISYTKSMFFIDMGDKLNLKRNERDRIGLVVS